MVLHLFKCPISRHLIFRFDDGAGARAFIGNLTPRVTMADVQLDGAPDPLLTIGITFQGLRALGVDSALLEEFDAIYKAGPDPIPLGDVPGSRSDPANWWERQFPTDDVHCIVHVYVRSDEAAEAATRHVRDLARQGQLTELIPRRDGTILEARSLGDARLHFGYRDGISHPDICWDDVPGTPSQLNFRTVLLGYPTSEYSSAPSHGPAAALVRNSTYGTFRWIYQDVAMFNRFLSTEGPGLFPHLTPADAEELLAAKLMGRWRDGTPLVLSPRQPDPHLSASDNFAYRDQDPDGRLCPFSAHIRVVNPRDQRLHPIIEGVPHVLRRGMPYGPKLEGTQDDTVDRGLFGIFLCADLRRQIYTLTGWIKRNDFSPVYDADPRTQDALCGNRALPGSSTAFTMPGDDGGVTISGLPHFIHTKGTVFLLYPGKDTLTALSSTS
ncbi:Dyp-type peroxidase [Microbispora triticiradicis]|uniref:Dyp-type peroxidase n=1 Tax=Microbispora triticiradicis TaxID=2200763 RepID=UPI001AD76F51|nr:hypothetical protein [Microbispora triticiradicis]MBO4271407.1 hypothetical protein [Microbispora triticiradicis]